MLLKILQFKERISFQIISSCKRFVIKMFHLGQSRIFSIMVANPAKLENLGAEEMVRIYLNNMC